MLKDPPSFLGGKGLFRTKEKAALFYMNNLDLPTVVLFLPAVDLYLDA
jgi:hypothetical protein